MTTHQTDLNPGQNNNPKNGIFSNGGRLLFTAVIFSILAIIIFQVSKDKAPVSSAESTQQETTTPPPAVLPQENLAGLQSEEPDAEELAASEASLGLTKEIEAGLNLFLTDWKRAWTKSAGSSDNLSEYFSFYADSFNSGSLDKKAWERSKTIRNQGKSWIEVWLSEIKIEPAEEKDQYHITFIQEYSSSNYSDKSTKMLTVSKEENGYKIIAEKTL